MIVQQTAIFAKQKKKLHANQVSELDKAIKQIIKNPKLGEQKKGDLRSIFVYKFKMLAQKTLVAYQINKDSLILIALGSHENFYKNLKLFLKS